MQRSPSSLLAALLAVILTPACGETADWVIAPETPALATRTEHDNTREPFSLPDVDNPCTSAIEAIDLEGTIHGQGSQWDNEHFKSHYNVTLTGVDADGVSYFGTSTGNGKGEFPGSENEDVVISTLLISRGGTDNFVVKIVLHHHKDGTVTVDKSGEECRG
jgi:hypothetical protein